MKRSWAYILKCADGSYYTGRTTNLDQPMYQHHAGTFKGYTSIRRPVRLVWVQEFSDVNDAIKAERQIKGWNRKKKEALIRNDLT